MRPIRIAVLTVSDRSSRGLREDLSGPAIQEMAVSFGWQVASTAVVPDEIVAIQEVLVNWADTGKFDIIFTTGGTGFAPRDVTPEATLGVIERPTPGISEALRANSLRITAHAILSRAVSGIRNNTLIINFPGSPRACRENLEYLAPVLPHAVDLMRDYPAAESGHLTAAPQE